MELTYGVWNAVAVGVDAQIESFLVRLNSLDDVVSDQQNFTLHRLKSNAKKLTN